MPGIPGAPLGSVHPQTLIDAISDLRMHSAELGRSEMLRLIPELDRIDFSVDNRPSRLAEVIARTVSIHSVATHLMENQSWDFLAVYYDGLDVAGHIFMPFHPPQMPCVSDDEFLKYRDVMRELYLFHDEMLGGLLNLAGDDTTVILLSDHGFHNDRLRPVRNHESTEEQAAAWHRQYGILAMHGAGILKDQRVYGATLLDVTPTVLQLFDLSIGRDMDGRPLLQALENPPEFPKTIASWDQQPGDDGMHPADLQRSMMESRAAVEQLIALGYLPPETAEGNLAVEIARAEMNFNLAIVHSSLGRNRKAIELLSELHRDKPDQPRYALALAKAYANDGQHENCRTIVEALEANGWRSLEGDLLFAASLFNDDQTDAAMARLAECERLYPPSATSSIWSGTFTWPAAVGKTPPMHLPNRFHWTVNLHTCSTARRTLLSKWAILNRLPITRCKQSVSCSISRRPIFTWGWHSREWAKRRGPFVP